MHTTLSDKVTDAHASSLPLAADKCTGSPAAARENFNVLKGGGIISVFSSVLLRLFNKLS
jgi:hypothetical protein